MAKHSSRPWRQIIQARAQYKWHLHVNVGLIMIKGHRNKNNLGSGSEHSMKDTNKTLNMLIAWWSSQQSG